MMLEFMRESREQAAQIREQNRAMQAQIAALTEGRAESKASGTSPSSGGGAGGDSARGGSGGSGRGGVGGPASAPLLLGLIICPPNLPFAGFQFFRSRTV